MLTAPETHPKVSAGRQRGDHGEEAGVGEAVCHSRPINLVAQH